MYCQDKIYSTKPLEHWTGKILIQRMALERAVGLTTVLVSVSPKNPAFQKFHYGWSAKEMLSLASFHFRVRVRQGVGMLLVFQRSRGIFLIVFFARTTQCRRESVTAAASLSSWAQWKQCLWQMTQAVTRRTGWPGTVSGWWMALLWVHSFEDLAWSDTAGAYRLYGKRISELN